MLIKCSGTTCYVVISALSELKYIKRVDAKERWALSELNNKYELA